MHSVPGYVVCITFVLCIGMGEMMLTRKEIIVMIMAGVLMVASAELMIRVILG